VVVGVGVAVGVEFGVGVGVGVEFGVGVGVEVDCTVTALLVATLVYVLLNI